MKFLDSEHKEFIGIFEKFGVHESELNFIKKRGNLAIHFRDQVWYYNRSRKTILDENGKWMDQTIYSSKTDLTPMKDHLNWQNLKVSLNEWISEIMKK